MYASHAVKRTRHEVHLSLDDVEETFPVRGGSDFQFRPNRAYLSWDWTPHGGWALQLATIRGGRVLKDGTTSALSTGKRDFEISGVLTDDAPEWLAELVEEYRPTGQVFIP
jgi:hypothetical protein